MLAPFIAVTHRVTGVQIYSSLFFFFFQFLDLVVVKFHGFFFQKFFLCIFSAVIFVQALIILALNTAVATEFVFFPLFSPHLVHLMSLYQTKFVINISLSHCQSHDQKSPLVALRLNFMFLDLAVNILHYLIPIIDTASCISLLVPNGKPGLHVEYFMLISMCISFCQKVLHLFLF